MEKQERNNGKKPPGKYVPGADPVIVKKGSRRNKTGITSNERTEAGSLVYLASLSMCIKLGSPL